MDAIVFLASIDQVSTDKGEGNKKKKKKTLRVCPLARDVTRQGYTP